MSIFKSVLVLAVFVFGSASAHAGLLLEPYVGYHLGTAKSAGDSDDVKGLSFGGRLGYTSLGFMGGFDYLTGQWSRKDGDVSVDQNPKDMGVFIGYDFPVLLRAYFTYVFSAKADLKTTPAAEIEGNGVKIGLGFTTLPLVSINLEYLAHTYTKATTNGVSGDLVNNITTSMYGISISAPFNF